MNGETGFLYLNRANKWPDFGPDHRRNLEIASDGSLRLVEISKDSFAGRGTFVGGPFDAPAQPGWYRLQVAADPLPAGGHIRLFTLTEEIPDEDDRAEEPPHDLEADKPFPGWRRAPRDGLDILIPDGPGRRLWIGGILRGDGRASPRLHQMRLDYGPETSLAHLPAIYRRNEAQRDFLERFLLLYESVLGGLEESITDLPRLFDPLGTPAEEYPSWLAWLAGWLAFDLNEDWTEAETRQYLAQAFQLYGQRGTVEGLRRYLKLYAGVEAHIQEPALQTNLWSLGETSTLGFTTTLAPAHIQGAVVGATATLDQSHLTRGEALGAALFEELAHRFCVQVYCAELRRPGSLADVRAVLEREKPAHTTYELCVIEPRLRVGVQARLGVDAIVAQGAPAAQAGMRLDTGVLAPARELVEGASPATDMEPCENKEE